MTLFLLARVRIGCDERAMMADRTALGVLLPLAPGQITSGEFLREWVGVVEECGVESAWGIEHVVLAHEYEPNYPYSESGEIPGGSGADVGARPVPDPLDTLAYVAAVSRTLKLGTSVVIAPLHSPAVLAKRVSTIDNLSGGRMILGLGIGWQREEYDAVGVPFRRRGARLEECIGAMRALWTQAPASYQGEYVTFDRVYSSPQPARGTVPIVLGGHSAPALERAGRIGNGWYPYTIGPEELASSAARLREVAAAAGRDPEEIEITVWPGSHDPQSEFDVDYVRRFVEAGAHRVLINPFAAPGQGLGSVQDQILTYRERVIDKL
jgi:probable F420-dependent oxidoreductase